MNAANQPTICEVVLTGGPCGGKTSAIPHLVERLRAHGYAAIVCGEAASRVFEMIPDPATRAAILADPVRNREFQDTLIGAQLNDRDQAHRLARLLGANQVVIIRDRDIIDNAAYIERSEFNSLLAGRGLTFAGARDRADIVLHMVTAADGAEKFYTTANNAARYESPAQARMQDRRTRAVWAGHPNHAVINNRGDFADKLERTWQALAAHLGLAVLGAPSRHEGVA